MTADEQALAELERRRCAAIGTADVAALKQVLSDDYVHVHMTGKIDDHGMNGGSSARAGSAVHASASAKAPPKHR